MDGQTYWDQIGYQKNFEDPFPLEKFSTLLPKEAVIVEYGCGYGRLLSRLQEAGFVNLKGYDYSKSMINRGKDRNPSLSFEHLSTSGALPLPDQSVDCLYASTVLCCVPAMDELTALFKEFHRVLKQGGTLFLLDFLLSKSPESQEKYQKGSQEHGEWGVYTTSEGLAVRHFQSTQLLRLLEDFDIQSFEQSDFKTMNDSPARIFQCFAERI